jgi:hypothetical protein
MINNEPVWIDVDCVGETTGDKIFGRFQVKRYLTHRERAEATRLAETYCRGIVDDLSQRAFLTTLAFLTYHVVDSDAKWWTGADPKENGSENGLSMIDEKPIWDLAKKIKELQKPAVAAPTAEPAKKEP